MSATFVPESHFDLTDIGQLSHAQIDALLASLQTRVTNLEGLDNTTLIPEINDLRTRVSNIEALDSATILPQLQSLTTRVTNLEIASAAQAANIANLQARVAVLESQEGNQFVYQQVAPALQWVVNHNLGRKPVSILVTDLTGETIETEVDIAPDFPYTVTVSSNIPTAGTVYLSTAPVGSFFPYQQTIPVLVWTIPNPLRRVPSSVLVLDTTGSWVDGQINVTPTDPFTVTVSFNTPTTGTAYLS